MHFPSLVLTALIAVTAALPASNHVVHERRTLASYQSWAKRDAVPGDMSLPMRIGLRQGNLHKGYDLLMDVSKHDSPNYGKHYSAEEVHGLFSPEAETIDTVHAWLEEAGISRDRVSQSANKAWLQFDAPTKEAEELLKTKFHFFEHLTTGDANIACDEYRVPGHVSEHIDYITPGVKLASTAGNSRKTKAKRDALLKRGVGIAPDGRISGPAVTKPLPPGYPLSQASNAQGNGTDLTTCGDVITPACIAALYQIPKGDKANANNQLGIYETGEAYQQQDLDDFFGVVYPDIPHGTGPDVYSVDGGIAPAPTYAGTEAELDLQLAYPIIYPQGVIYYQVDDEIWSDSQYTKLGLFNTFLDALDGSYCTFSYEGEAGDNPAYDGVYPDPHPGGYTGELQCGIYKPANVISISYGVNEADYTIAYQQRQCQEWMKLGLQGVSVVLASGDSGVGGRAYQNGHIDGCLGNGTIFNPDYPGTCPYFTTVGATYLPPGGNASAIPTEEVATTSFSSGGGFSNLYPAPNYQKQAIDDYFRNADPIVKAYPYYSSVNNASLGADGGIYNRNGRGYPDVSANGDNALIFDSGYPELIGGTSAATPIFASILTRINEERLAVGKSTIGFVNPVLYANPDAFNDILVGNNTACNSAGFIASKGWDPVTGLGTPNYPKLLDVFLNLS